MTHTRYTPAQRKSARQAYRQLERRGCPVRKTQDAASGYSQYGGLFAISAEEANSDLWLNYYPESYTRWDHGTHSDQLQAVLEAKGLYLEWYNPAVAVVYPV